MDLVSTDKRLAEELLSEAYTKLQDASKSIPASTINPLRAQVVALLDRLYQMSVVTDEVIFQFPDDPAVDLRTVVKGPDGAPFVLDAATKTVYRIDLKNGKASTIFREGNTAAGRKEAAPKRLAVGGRDLLILDEKNIVWRWRPANSTGKGTLNRFPSGVSGSSEWGADILAIGTFLRDREANLYNFYVVDVSAQQILRYSPAADGGGFPAAPSKWLSAARDVSGITSLYIDGDIWLADSGALLRVVNGNAAGWDAASPGDEILRDEPGYTLIGSGAERRTGTIYGFDGESRPPDRALQGQRLVPRAVPAARRGWHGQWLVRLPVVLHRAGGRDRARRGRLDRQGRPPSIRAPGRGRARGVSGGQQRRGRIVARRRAVIPLRDRNPTRRTPVVTFALIGACFAVFALELSITASRGDAALEAFFQQWGAVPADITAAIEGGNLASQATVGIFASMFLHGGWLHLLGKHAVPLDLRQQRRGSAGPDPVRAVLPRRGDRRGADPGR